MPASIIYRFLTIVTFLYSSFAWSHSGSTAYMEIQIENTRLDGAWWINLKDLQVAVGLDTNVDDRITFSEFKQHRQTILSFAEQNVKLKPSNKTCAIRWQTPTLSSLEDGVYAEITFSSNCAEYPTMVYSALFDLDDSHRALVELNSPAGKRVLIFSPTNRELSLDTYDASPWQDIGIYIQQGVIHILEGYDHLLFLLALLVPIIFARPKTKPHLDLVTADNTIKQIITALLKVVSAFTVGHSITLISASALSFMPPIAWTETIIAVSVIFAGLNILVPMFRESSWKVALLFGFVHGFGFANVLAQLALDRSHLLLALVSFNIGVELGQVVVVAIATPLFLLVAGGKWLPTLARIGAASTAALVGLVWVIERLPIP